MNDLQEELALAKEKEATFQEELASARHKENTIEDILKRLDVRFWIFDRAFQHWNFFCALLILGANDCAYTSEFF